MDFSEYELAQEAFALLRMLALRFVVCCDNHTDQVVSRPGKPVSAAQMYRRGIRGEVKASRIMQRSIQGI